MFILGLVSHFDDITVRSMRALYSTEEEWYTLVKQSGGDKNLKSLNNVGLPLSQATEKKIFTALRTMIKLELDEKETSLSEDMKLLEEYENVRAKGGNKKNKKEKNVMKKGFAGKDKEIEKDSSLEKIQMNKIERELEVDPSGFYGDGEFAALTFRIEKKKILLDALEKVEI